MLRKIIGSIFGSTERSSDLPSPAPAKTHDPAPTSKRRPSMPIPPQGKRIVSEVSDRDFMGKSISASGSRFSVEFGARLDSSDLEDRIFRLIESGMIKKSGRLPRRIEEADILRDGTFILSLIGDSEKKGSDIWVFNHEGEQITSVFLPDYLTFLRLQEPLHLLFSASNAVTLLSLKPLKEVFRFEVPNGFYPTDGWLEADLVKLEDRDQHIYSFRSDGTFSDYPIWRERFLAEAKAPLIFSFISQEFQAQARSEAGWGKDEFLSAAKWLERALKQGEPDSYSYKKANVLALRASLLRKAGDTVGAEQSEREAQENRDGFRVIDDIEGQLKGSELDQEQFRQILTDLHRAKDYPRIDQYPNYFGRLYRFLGEAYLGLGQVDDAITAFEKAIEINPKVGCKKQLNALKKQA